VEECWEIHSSSNWILHSWFPISLPFCIPLTVTFQTTQADPFSVMDLWRKLAEHGFGIIDCSGCVSSLTRWRWLLRALNVSLSAEWRRRANGYWWSRQVLYACWRVSSSWRPLTGNVDRHDDTYDTVSAITVVMYIHRSTVLAGICFSLVNDRSLHSIRSVLLKTAFVTMAFVQTGW